MRDMKTQFFAGFVVAVLALVGVWSYASWGTSGPQDSTSQEGVQKFITEMRAKVVAEIGQPIEGFEPFMFMRVFPGLTAQDFDGVDALIGLYRYQDGEIVYDLNGEQELHSAARAISDEGMEQLFGNILSRITMLEGSDPVEAALGAISAAPGPDPTAASGANAKATMIGVITCLPHKGDGPHTLECAFGLKGDDGYYYGLRDLWEVAPEMTETNVRVRVTGTLTKPIPDEKYDIAGHIDVETITKL
jgi:hypothetical protein